MAHDMVVKSLLQHVAAGIVIVKLLSGVLVLIRLVGDTQVGEYRCWLNHLLALEQLDQLGQLFTCETQSVHAAVDLDVHRKSLHAISLALLDEVLGHLDAVEFGFQAILEHSLIVHPIGIEHDHWHGDAGLAQFHALVLDSNGQIVAATVL